MIFGHKQWEYETRGKGALNDMLKSCGDAGWELAAVFNDSTGQPVFIFKRLKLFDGEAAGSEGK